VEGIKKLDGGQQVGKDDVGRVDEESSHHSYRYGVVSTKEP
jgi:hypothetical protein